MNANDTSIAAESASFNQTRTAWSDACLVGMPQMDHMHEEFFLVARRLLACHSTNAGRCLDEFIDHARRHFKQEDEWMERTGFPPRECHIKEHEDVLLSALDLRSALVAGQIEASKLQEFASFLFQWFPGHVDYLDSALAAWMSQQQHGGKPVVLRRDLAALVGR